ncbi:S-adenosyl-L-methionine-dependent methyltransferase [Blyttiomyces helicus]|uniref:S-adenosyl-L-methionine-dependent methyltransferase n=1 Tax=Blyttiomyces helicus TaxID=388810 RepID=A0A4P9WKH1_9FUNG|nr:S-adenosyl-L-methionine-dependent methyltransferase [Blyttiomyces helicus]|eukprot:RKO91106.1 S-adenosyl-L-methionine-dependent methyltransferase [Blyttiomyces helicus]
MRPKPTIANITPIHSPLPSDLPALLRLARPTGPIPYLDSPSLPSPHKRGALVEAKIIAETEAAVGVGIDADGWLVLVPLTLVGEQVKARVDLVEGGIAHARVPEEIVVKSAERVEPPCKLFERCSSCQLMHVGYDAQLARKRDMVSKAFAEHAEELGLDTGSSSQDADASATARMRLPVPPVVPSPLKLGFRTKFTPHYNGRNCGETIDAIGFKVRAGGGIIDIDRCPVATDAINHELTRVRARLIGQRAHGFAEGATLLFRNSLAFVDSKQKPPATITTHTDIVTDVISGTTLRYPANSFFQTNSSILPPLISHIRETLAPFTSPPAAAAHPRVTTLVDAFCGSGIFALTLSEQFERTVGIEIDEQAVRWAKRAAQLSSRGGGRKRPEFFTGNLDDVFGAVIDPALDPDRTAVIVDPPSKGCGDRFLRQVLSMSPKVIVYVSCNVRSLVEDVRVLVKGYRVADVRAFDMFPQTVHCECVATLVRND